MPGGAHRVAAAWPTPRLVWPAPDPIQGRGGHQAQILLALRGGEAAGEAAAGLANRSGSRGGRVYAGIASRLRQSHLTLSPTLALGPGPIPNCNHQVRLGGK